MDQDNLDHFQDAYKIGYEKTIHPYAAATEHIDQGLGSSRCRAISPPPTRLAHFSVGQNRAEKQPGPMKRLGYVGGSGCRPAYGPAA